MLGGFDHRHQNRPFELGRFISETIVLGSFGEVHTELRRLRPDRVCVCVLVTLPLH